MFERWFKKDRKVNTTIDNLTHSWNSFILNNLDKPENRLLYLFLEEEERMGLVGIRFMRIEESIAIFKKQFTLTIIYQDKELDFVLDRDSDSFEEDFNLVRDRLIIRREPVLFYFLHLFFEECKYSLMLKKKTTFNNRGERDVRLLP